MISLHHSFDPINEKTNIELNELRLKVIELENKLKLSEPSFIHIHKRNDILLPLTHTNLINNNINNNHLFPQNRISTAPPELNSSILNKEMILYNNKEEIHSNLIHSYSEDLLKETILKPLSIYNQPYMAKIAINENGKMNSAISERYILYNIIRKIYSLNLLTEDQICLLKRIVDAEYGNVVKVLKEINFDIDTNDKIKENILILLENCSPSKIKILTTPSKFLSNIKIGYLLEKIANNLKNLGEKPLDIEVVVLVSSGAYNPVHMLHIRSFYVARQYIEANTNFPVVGGIISPCHNTYVRLKNRRTPKQMIPAKHRLGLLEAAVQSSSWIEIDKWEITRRRVLDYLSALNHVRNICTTHFPEFKFRILYVCGCNTMVRLSHLAIRNEGFGCVAVCRPAQTALLEKQLGSKWSKIAMIVEDTGVLSCELEATTSFRVRKALMEGHHVKGMVGVNVSNYIIKHDIGDKIAGKIPWTNQDKAWREEDKPFVEYQE